MVREKTDMPQCAAIWVGKFKDDKGTFEILIPSCNREDAFNRIKVCLDKIKNGKVGILQKSQIVGKPELLYIDEVGSCDYIRD